MASGLTRVFFLLLLLGTVPLLISCGGDGERAPADNISAHCQADGEDPAVCDCIASILGEHLSPEELAMLSEALDKDAEGDPSRLTELFLEESFINAMMAAGQCSSQ